MKIASIAFTENGAKIVKMLVHEMDSEGGFVGKWFWSYSVGSGRIKSDPRNEGNRSGV